MNYAFTYASEKYISSAVVALIFMAMLFFNMVGMHLFFRKPIASAVKWGAVLGGTGLFLIFWRQLHEVNFNREFFLGAGLALTAAFFASLGNMFSFGSSQRKIPVLQSTTWAMIYGAALNAILCIAFEDIFHVPAAPEYWISLIYLAVPGTVLAFLGYLTLIARLGVERAVYTTVVSPVVALIISTFFESFQWSFLTFLGIALTLIGNIFTLRKAQQIRTVNAVPKA